MSADPDIDARQWAADIERSRASIWEVEDYLAERHRRKFEVLTQPEDKWAARKQVAWEVSDAVFIQIGRVATFAMLGHWFLTGDFIPGPY